MNVLNNYYEEVANKWKSQKGIGSVYCLKPFSYSELAINIINKVLAKNKDSRIFIVTDCFNTRQSIIDAFYKNNKFNFQNRVGKAVRGDPLSIDVCSREDRQIRETI